MTLFPLSLSLKNRKCIVAGAGSHAHSIVNELCSAGAHVTAIGISAQGTNLPEGSVGYSRAFEAADLDGCWLAVAASESDSENETVIKQCEDRQIFCYVPTNKEAGTWQLGEALVNPHSEKSTQSGAGFVSLVGAGPGHPDLLTIRALQLIQSADAIVYDRLVSDPILALCNREAEFVYAGKEKANHTLPQQSINTLLVELAGRYKNVVRLKGGDPFIFGRGGEEIETLADSEVPFQIVPGITAASGCAAFAGIPLTHRDHAQSCIFVTGHLRNGNINLNWNELKDPHQTIVVYMGLTGVEVICKSLIEHGRSAQTPAALIERGTKPEQRVLSSTLSDLPSVVANNDVSAPTMLIIGGVVSLRDKLKWF